MKVYWFVDSDAIRNDKYLYILATTTISPKTNLNRKPKSPTKPKRKKPIVKELREAKIKVIYLPVASYFSGKNH